MGRFFAGVLSALLFVAAGLFWWQSAVDADMQPRVANGGLRAEAPPLPGPGDPNARGAPPPDVPEATERTREQKRFDRYDRNRDGVVTRLEMMASRTSAFRKLDKDGNNLLSFEEWAVATSTRFAGADANRDGRLVPVEFATTAPRPSATRAGPVCKCEED
ncbi:hypothetical protein M2337_002099 [Sphingobium sp. B2D3A]|uniref:EF-hand domain-containing protein n=1 Tax=unclassified Sphingobium TaxID=2611147 RepID=UPI002225401A|nr:MULTISPECIES: EF-hand domain-containing protein [unclassified Sphingobium]MCW2337866.1 hypothetical protein [Sphingobium sp. B2D3A]MCW2350504.1 hypothetical protein [Sphingobium sp. B12D2B]MCW2369607.1 hypothetical protein [Sphingobium sp. B11D3D]MCW2384324.1 hypothetical protein [Sphingobium sp. B2D3D]MCW2390654.1 hypothetical protein [Sphingobium sp. B11D3A]